MALAMLRNPAVKSNTSGSIFCKTSWALLLVMSDTEHKDGEKERQ